MSTARRPFSRTGVVAAVVVLGAATGCGASSTKTAGSPAKVGPGSSTPPTAAAGTSAAARPPLVVYSAQGYDGPVTKAFSKALESR